MRTTTTTVVHLYTVYVHTTPHSPSTTSSTTATCDDIHHGSWIHYKIVNNTKSTNQSCIWPNETLHFYVHYRQHISPPKFQFISQMLDGNDTRFWNLWIRIHWIWICQPIWPPTAENCRTRRPQVLEENIQLSLVIGNKCCTRNIIHVRGCLEFWVFWKWLSILKLLCAKSSNKTWEHPKRTPRVGSEINSLMPLYRKTHFLLAVK